MTLQKYIIYIKIILIISISVFCQPKDSSDWIWQVEGKKYTVNDFEDAHEAFVFLMAQQLNRTPEQLKPFIEDPEKAGDPRLAKLLEALKKENFPELYKRILLLNHDAEKKGFLKQRKIEKRLEFLQKYFVTSLYLEEKVNLEDIKVSDLDAANFLEALRKNNPAYEKIPITPETLEEAKNAVRMRKLGDMREEYVSQIRESYKIEKNDKFDLIKYLDEKKSSESKGESEKADNKDSKSSAEK
ncbi:MAG: hypothetical protein OEZ22_00140 [Spirochaetia bacterium]|nr:hypothetical protein [Spirochaetia bacterium]